jgi:tetratricopeptide (TPR) repeat protein
MRRALGYFRHMTSFRQTILATAVTVSALLGSSCRSTSSRTLDPLPAGIEALSLRGDTLRAMPVSAAARERLESDLRAAEAQLNSRPNDPDAHIWVGRRLAYLGRYREAIAAFTTGTTRFPKDARFYRHRGHRFITVRRFDLAIADFDRARELIRGTPDQVEPDGAPNPRGIPTSTLHTNVWYHLGLAHFLRGSWAPALSAFEQGSAISPNPDMKVAMDYWRFLSLKRLGRDTDALALARSVAPNQEIIENDAYYDLLGLYAGRVPVDSVLPASRLATVTPSDAAAAYGVSQHYLFTNRSSEAQLLWSRMVRSGQWPAFGVIAAEAELARLP